MNTTVVDDDEELLLLRIKALKSTPRVSISVQFTSDSDNDTSVNDIKKKKHHERRTRSSSYKEKIGGATTSSHEDDDEIMLRQLALNSVRKRSSEHEQSSNLVVLSSNDNQTTIEISQNVASSISDSVSVQQVIISNSILTGNSIQESSAIQHDLISSTSEDPGCGKRCPHSLSSNVEPTCSQKIMDSVKYSCISSSSESSNSISTCKTTELNTSDIDFKAEVVHVPISEIDQTDENSSANNASDIFLKKPLDKNIIKEEDVNCPNAAPLLMTFPTTDGVHSKPVMNCEKLLPNPLVEDAISSESEIGNAVSNDANVDIVIQKKYPLALKQKFVQAQLGCYSPSSPSESEEDDNPNSTLNTGENDVVCNDDVLSLCTSDKDDMDLDGIAIRFNTKTKAKEKKLKIKPKLNNLNLSLQKADSSVSADTHSLEKRTATELDLDNSYLLDKTDKKSQLLSQTTESSLPENDASGLNIILDRYLNEVAANRKMARENQVNEYSDNEDERVVSSNMDDSGKRQSVEKNATNVLENWVECKPGPSGYMQTLIPDYGSDSDDSITGVTYSTGNSIGLAEEGTGVKKCEAIDEQDGSGKREDLKDVTCSICLGPFENRSFLNSCFHSFCYMCIVQWSELSRLCPLCKTKYLSLIHSVNTDLDYEMYEFPDILPEKEIMPIRREFSEIMEDGRRFRYRSTIVDRDEWEARRLERERLEQEYIASRQQRRMRRRLKWSATKDMRKTVYQKGLQVKEVKQRGNPKYRDISPTFFHENPALKHRLVPWLLRDLNVLLGNKDENIRFVMSLILNLISKLSMKEDAFKEQLQPFLFDQTDHFVAELVSFASSPYDIRGYDKHVKYSKPENDVEITFTSYPAIEISDGESPSAGDQETIVFNEGLNSNVDLQAPLNQLKTEDKSNNILTDGNNLESILSVLSEGNEGLEDISPVDRFPDISQAGKSSESNKAGSTTLLTADNNVTSVADGHRKEMSAVESSSDDMCNQVRKKRRKNTKKERKKKRKRKRRSLDSDTSYKKKKKSKKESHKRSRKEIDTDIPLSKDPCEDFPLRKRKHGDIEDDVITYDNNNQKGIENKKTSVMSLNNEESNKKIIEKSKTSHKDKKKRAEQKNKRKHRKKYKYVKHVKHKRKRLKSFSSEDDEDDDDKSVKYDKSSKVEKIQKSERSEHTSSKKCTTHPGACLDKKTRLRGNHSDDDTKRTKKSLKRKSSSSGTEQERPTKRKKREKVKSAPDGKNKHKRREKKKKKHKHKKSSEKNSNVSSTETGNSSDKKVDKELRSKIDHAINAIMDTKGGNNSSDDEDEFLNSQEVQDLLSKYKYNDKLDLIKDGDAYKTRAEVVQELLLIEKAITRRKEKKKQKQINQASKSVAASGKNASQMKDLAEKPSGQLQIDKAAKKAEREKSYKVLIKELQEIEGRINSCRSSLQVKPSDMI